MSPKVSLAVLKEISAGLSYVVKEHRQSQDRIGSDLSDGDRRVSVNIVNMMFVMLFKAESRRYFRYDRSDDLGKTEQYIRRVFSAQDQF